MQGDNRGSFLVRLPHYWRNQGGRQHRLGIGCATIGRAADAEELRQFQRMLDTAYEAGFRYFDTSARYGGSEFRLGEFVRRVPRDEIFVATKSGIPAELTPAEAGQYLRQGIQNSCERLGVSRIDLFQVHDVPSLDSVFAPGGGLEVLQQAQADGLIEYIGLGVRFHDLLLQAARSGYFDTVLTYLDFTPLNTRAARLIGEVAERGVGVINGSPLALGLLTGKDPRTIRPDWGEARQWYADAVRLYDFCLQCGWSPLGIALQFPMRHPGIHMTLTAPASVEELQSTLTAIETPLSDSEWMELTRHMIGENRDW